MPFERGSNRFEFGFKSVEIINKNRQVLPRGGKSAGGFTTAEISNLFFSFKDCYLYVM
jgi:hypothetical protein